MLIAPRLRRAFASSTRRATVPMSVPSIVVFVVLLLTMMPRQVRCEENMRLMGKR